ncbi:MAG: NusA-like transcription termination signal-binding factor [Candidatus Woesearchaeota archaeon]
MNRIKFDTDLMKIISIFQSITMVSVKDCIAEPDRITVVVAEGEASRAIGPKGSTARRIEQALNRKLKIVEFNSDVKQFTRNLIHPLKAKEISEQDGKIIITSPDLQTRGYLIGRSAKQLRAFEGIIKRHFPITEVKII